MARFVNVQKAVAIMFFRAFCEHVIIIQGGGRQTEREAVGCARGKKAKKKTIQAPARLKNYESRKGERDPKTKHACIFFNAQEYESRLMQWRRRAKY